MDTDPPVITVGDDAEIMGTLTNNSAAIAVTDVSAAIVDECGTPVIAYTAQSDVYDTWSGGIVYAQFGAALTALLKSGSAYIVFRAVIGGKQKTWPKQLVLVQSVG